jgi:glutamate-1-semialdehyde 2,1-aminomutase
LGFFLSLLVLSAQLANFLSFIAHRIVGHETLFDVVFTRHEVRSYRDVLGADTARSARFNAVLRENGIFKSPGKTYPHLALTEADFEMTDTAIAKAAAAVADE